MNLPSDLRNYHPSDDLGAFQIIEGDTAIVLLCVGIVLGFMAGAFS